MKSRSLVDAILTIRLVVMLLITINLPLSAQDKPVFETEQLTENLYLAWTDEGSYTTNILIHVGPDGILLVDSNTDEKAEELKKLVHSFGKGDPKYIINTHRHVEHVGGNAIFGGTPVIIAHDLVPSKLRSGSYLLIEFPDETFPDITFTDSLFLEFNGERIRMVDMGGSHDDNEIFVHFTKAKVVHLSSIINGMNFPSIDSDGDLLKFASLTERAMQLLPDDVTIVSGHNRLAKYSDLAEYRDMINETIDLVRQGISDGKDVTQMQEENTFAAYERFNQSYVSPNQWVEYIHERLTRDESAPEKMELFEPIYYAIKEGGAQGGKDKYYDLKENHADKYDFEETHLLVIGDKLLGHDYLAEATEMLKLYLSEHPEGRYRYYANYDLAVVAKKRGDKKAAIEYCNESLKLNPDFKAADDLLAELK